MPRGNGNGPMGMGPKTGRAMGYCTGYAEPGYINQYRFGRGYGCGNRHGNRHGHRHMYNATGRRRWARYQEPVNAGPADAFDEKMYLKNQADYLAQQLEQVNKRLSALENETE